MRRMVIALGALIAATAAGSGAPELHARKRVDCTDYCALKAAQNCDRVGSLKCDAYIWGCLAGCNLAQL